MGKLKIALSTPTRLSLFLLALAVHGALQAKNQESHGTAPNDAVEEGKSGFWHRSFQPTQYFTNLEHDAKRFNEKDRNAKDGRATQAALTDYAQAGMTLSDSACAGWLQTLAYSERDTNFFKDILNIVGNLILGISGINGANPSSLARGSLGLAAGNATIEAYQNEVILGTISDIQAKLEEGRRTSAAYFVQHVPDNYDETKRRLAEYHGTCTPGAVKTLLKSSLAAVKYVAPDTSLAGPIAQMNADIAAVELSNELFPKGKGAQLSDDALYKLYVSAVLMPTSQADFVTAAKADAFVQSIAVNFMPKDNAQLALIQIIADNRGYVARAQAELKKELDQDAAKKVSDATRDAEAANKAKDDAIAKVSENKAESKKNRDAILAAFPQLSDKVKDPNLTDTDIIKLASAVETTTPSQKEALAKAMNSVDEKSQAVAKLVTAEASVQHAQASLSNALSLQTTLKSSAFDTRRTNPSSISALLVPVK